MNLTKASWKRKKKKTKLKKKKKNTARQEDSIFINWQDEDCIPWMNNHCCIVIVLLNRWETLTERYFIIVNLFFPP